MSMLCCLQYHKSLRLDTAGGNPFAMTAHMLINTKSEGLGEGEDSPLSSPVLDESYKIRIPLSRSSLSPHSPEVGTHQMEDRQISQILKDFFFF